MRFPCVDRDTGICSHQCVKFSLPLILAIIAITFTLNACTTLANRRDLYSPDRPQGPYTDMLYHADASEVAGKTPRVKNH
jgi:hypothetical protein